MKRVLWLLAFLLQCFNNQIFATVVPVSSLGDSGEGTLRHAIDIASDNDTVLINVSGTIILNSPINIDSKADLYIIGPYPTHNTIQAAPDMEDALFEINNSGPILIKGVGFGETNSATRHVNLSNCSEAISFEYCLFENSDISAAGNSGGCFEVGNSYLKLNSCSFVNNAADKGGVIYSNGSAEVMIQNCTFSDNNARLDGGALCLGGNTTYYLIHNTFVNNQVSESGDIEAVYASPGTTGEIGFNAVYNNGTDEQFKLSGTVTSHGGNRIVLNDPGESTGDYFTGIGDDSGVEPVVTAGLRAALKTDGYGLKYWSIIDESSFFINTRSATADTPELDGRKAPRSMSGPSLINIFPDAGAIEYTHLKVTNTSFNALTPNSIYWALSALQSKVGEVNYIEFDIAGSPAPIEFTDAISVPSEVYHIDAFSQNGSAVAGPPAEGAVALTPAELPIHFSNDGTDNYALSFGYGTSSSQIIGLRITGFNNYGIRINNGANQLKIMGCEVGLNEDGTINGNGSVGIKINGDDLQLGDWEHWSRNVISGNGQNPVRPENSNVYAAAGESVVIIGNIIGGSATGMEVPYSPEVTKYGLVFVESENEIGASRFNSGNLIVGHEYGIYFTYVADQNSVKQNRIGILRDNTAGGNTIAGIYLSGSDDNNIGGLNNDLEGNIIAYNGTGIALITETTAARQNKILGNRIFQNAGQGIDFNNDGEIFANDGGLSSDQNDGIDHPVISGSSACSGVNTETTYELSVPTAANYWVEFYTVSAPDAGGAGEGETFLGRDYVYVTSNPQTFTFTHDAAIPDGTTITATVTSVSNNNTSEFGINSEVTGVIEDFSIAYDDICYGENAVPVPGYVSGGVFSFAAPAPASGETLDSESGELSGAQEGETYQVVYTLSEGCFDQDTGTVSVKSVDESFSYSAGPHCKASAIVPETIATAGGVFSIVTPADDATIDSESGTFSDGEEGISYTIQYIVTSDGCEDTGTVVLPIYEVDETFSISDFCPEVTSAPATVATPGGDFSITPADGVTIAGDGAVTGATEGVEYTISYTVGACPDTHSEIAFAIETDESFVFEDFCPETTGTVTSVATEGGTFELYSAPAADMDVSIDPADGSITNADEGGVYEVIYTVGSCNDKDTQTVNVFTVIENFEFADFCPGDESPAPVMFGESGTFSFELDLADGATIDEETGVIYNPVEGTTYGVMHTRTDPVNGCTEDTVVNVMVMEVNEAFSFDDFCPTDISPEPVPEVSGGEFNLIASSPFDPSAEIDIESGVISAPSEGVAYEVTYTVSDPTATCFQTDTVVVEVIATDESFVFNNFCAEFGGMPLSTAVPGGVFNLAPDPADGIMIDPYSGELSNAIPETTYAISYTVGVCDEKDTVWVTALPSENASFNLPDHCANIETEAEITGLTGGSFDFNTSPTDDATINEVNAIITDASGGVYEVRYITPGSAETCADTSVLAVNLFATPEIITLSSEQNLYCTPNTILPIEVTESTLVSTFYWYNNPAETPIAEGESFVPDTLLVGINEFYVRAESEHECMSDFESYTLQLSDISGMRAGEDVSICLGYGTEIQAYGGSSYQWYASSSISDLYSANPTVFTIEPETFVVDIRNDDNCLVKDSVKLTFLDQSECEIEVFNAFSPNNDGKNDMWYIDNLINYQPNTVSIYTRWGDLLLEIENYDNITTYWDGKDKNGNPLPPGTYFYVVMTGNPKQNQAGWVQIVL